MFVMAEIGQVIEIFHDNKITVKLERKEACAKCRACTAGLSSKEMLIKAINRCNASVGDNVEIVIEEKNFIAAVFIMYGIPFLFLLIGIFLGYWVGGYLKIEQKELFSFVLGIIFVCLSYLIIRTKENYWKSKNFSPKAIKIIK